MSNYLKIENITKIFGKGRAKVKAVDNINFSIELGKVTLIMGPSGSGKTTLLTMLGSLLSPDEGSIYYGDIEITKLSDKEKSKVRSRDLGFVFQSFNLLSALNTWENVAIPLILNGEKTETAKKKSLLILKKLGLSERVNYLISDLSGGEKQRVAIARALVHNPKLVLADEPTANLDSKSGHNVAEILRDIAKKEDKGIIIVSHDMRLLDIADRVLWLEDGKITEGAREFVVDPVCEMKLEKRLAPFSVTINRKEIYFCSEKCKNTYLKK